MRGFRGAEKIGVVVDQEIDLTPLADAEESEPASPATRKRIEAEIPGFGVSRNPIGFTLEGFGLAADPVNRRLLPAPARLK